MLQIDDTVALKAKKFNKLSTNLCPSPIKVVQKTGTKVTVRNEAGEEFRRDTEFVKKNSEQDGVFRSYREENSLSEEVGQKQKIIHQQ